MSRIAEEAVGAASDLSQYLRAKMLPDETVKVFAHRHGFPYTTMLRWIQGGAPSAHWLAELRRLFTDLPPSVVAGKAQGRGSGPVRCSGCGRPTAVRPPQNLATYDPSTHTFTCGDCQDKAVTLDVACERCSKVKRMPRYRARQIKSFKASERGCFYVCRRCSSRDAAKRARGALLYDHHGVLPSDGADVQREAMQTHLRTYIARPGKRGGSRHQTISEKARERQSVGRLAKGRRLGEFRRCPKCHLLVYLRPVRIRRGARGYHADCYEIWRSGETFQLWIKDLRSRTGAARERWLRKHPAPLPPRPLGRQMSSRQLDLRFRWLVRRVGSGESWRDIEASDNYRHSTVREGVLYLISILPSSWELVFGAGAQAEMLKKTVPIEEIRLTTGLDRANLP